jgi:hypothetical protein
MYSTYDVQPDWILLTKQQQELDFSQSLPVATW